MCTLIKQSTPKCDITKVVIIGDIFFSCLARIDILFGLVYYVISENVFTS